MYWEYCISISISASMHDTLRHEKILITLRDQEIELEPDKITEKRPKV